MHLSACSVILSFWMFELSGSTIIVIEDAKSCYRRVLTGKRVARAFVRKTLQCESVDACQQECAYEKRFVCEAFNYRLDTRGRGRGECELLDLPLSRLDMRRDLYPDPDYDYYEKDRNGGVQDCNGGGVPSVPYPYYPSGGYGGSSHNVDGFQGGNYDRNDGFANRRPPYYEYDRPRPISNDGVYDNRLPADDRHYRPNADRRGGDIPTYHRHYHQNRNDNNYYHYHSYYDRKKPYNRRFPGVPYLPENDRRDVVPHYDPNPWHKYYHDRQKDGNYWGLNKGDSWSSYGNNYGKDYNNYRNHNRFDNFATKNYYLPSKVDGYGGSFGGYKYGGKHYSYGEIPPQKPSPGKFLPDDGWRLRQNSVGDDPFFSSGYDFAKNECSLRTKSGFKLRRAILKKVYTVSNIYECEYLCFKENEFPCQSYSFRYTQTPSTPPENCYLSPRDYKQLDFYADLEPDRDFDIYTMNNKLHCERPRVNRQRASECFWRVRSGQRLDSQIIRDSLTVKSVLECQVQCLRSVRFTCRAFSFRYGSPVIGNSIDNCLLTDWPFYELDPRTQFVPEPGFEVYDRGSYGYGCEPSHFSVRGKEEKHDGVKIDQICYVEFSTPAKLLPAAIGRVLEVATELECQIACSNARENTLFQCMSFSYQTAPKGAPNCELSDILQRDLLSDVDYTHDSHSWLFAWDNYNPKCAALANKRLHRDDDFDTKPADAQRRHNFGKTLGIFNALDTWRVYSVSGWPCRRGSYCKQNTVAGFWYCELENGEANSWDYCCRPDHQCGYSEGFSYQWCYVGPVQTQWRKCSERYYPYFNHGIVTKSYLPWSSNSIKLEWTQRPGARPDRPEAPPQAPPERPSLDEYEAQFADQFLAPPKPGGMGRRWPVSYLHKEMPPNSTESSGQKMGKSIDDNKFTAIENLIKVIKSNDLKNVKYQISNDSNKEDDVLYVKIPLPANFSQETGTEKVKILDEGFSVLYLGVQKSTTVQPSATTEVGAAVENKTFPVYRRSYIERTNVTNYGYVKVRNNANTNS